MKLNALLMIATVTLGTAIASAGTAAAATRTEPFACYLKPGDSGYGVRHLQGALRDCYRASLPITGRYDARTTATILRVQKLHGVKADGVYGPATMKAMVWRLYHDISGVDSERCYSPF